MFPLAHSNYRDISLIFKSAVSTQTFRHIFKERLHLYYTKKVFIIQTILDFFFSLSGEQWSRPTHNSTCANCLADSPYSQQVCSPNFIINN